MTKKEFIRRAPIGTIVKIRWLDTGTDTKEDKGVHPDKMFCFTFDTIGEVIDITKEHVTLAWLLWDGKDDEFDKWPEYRMFSIGLCGIKNLKVYHEVKNDLKVQWAKNVKAGYVK